MDTIDYLKLGFFAVSASIVGAFSYFTLKVYLNHRKYRHIPGPSNNGISGFYLGDALNMAKHLQKEIPYAKQLLEYVETYGPIIKVNFLGNTMIHIADPEAIKTILIDENVPKHKKFYEAAGYPLGERFIGKSMVIESNDEIWRKSRSMFNNAFHRQELKSYMDEFNSTSDAFIERLRLVADGKTSVLLFDEFSRCTMDMISNIAFGMEMESLKNPDNKPSYYLNYISNSIPKFILDPLFQIKPKNRSKVKEFRNIVKEFRTFAKEQILNRMKDIKNDENVRKDLLTFILKNQENQDFDIEAMIDEFLTFFTAGHETTSCALAFFFLEVGRHPEVYEKLKNEIDNVIGSRSVVLFEDLNKLEYTTCVFKEVLRLYPPASYLTRLTAKPIKLGDYDIPVNSWLMVSPYTAQHYSKNFSDPYKFNPDRFENSKNINSYTYFPFSLGPRNCIGQTFAQFESKVIIAKIIQNFDIVLDLNQSFEAIEIVMLKPKDKTKCYLTLRH